MWGGLTRLTRAFPHLALLKSSFLLNHLTHFLLLSSGSGHPFKGLHSLLYLHRLSDSPLLSNYNVQLLALLTHAYLEHNERQGKGHQQVDHQRHQIKIHGGGRKPKLMEDAGPGADGKVLETSPYQLVFAQACAKRGREGKEAYQHDYDYQCTT